MYFLIFFRQEKRVFDIANEIMTSERAFVAVLRLVHVTFREFARDWVAATKRPFDSVIPRADFDRIFSNISDLLVLNSDLLFDFEMRIQNWESHKKIADVIVRKGAYLKLYTTYVKDFMEVQQHFDDCIERYPKFAKLVREFEAKEICHKLKLQHFMLKPVQVRVS